MSLPKPSGKISNSGGAASTKLPAPTGGDFDPFFKAEIVGKLGTKAELEVIGAPIVNETEFSDMQLPIRFKGTDYSMGLKTSSGNYARLYKRFGTNPAKWKGKVKIEVKHFKANDYIAIV